MNATLTNNNNNNGRLLMMLAFLGIVFLAVMALVTYSARVTTQATSILYSKIDTSESHAWREHPEDQSIVRKCLDNPNTQKWVVETQDPFYFLIACFDGYNISFQIVKAIVDKWGRTTYKEVTAYIKDGFHTTKRFLQYIKEVGYTIIQ